jgi:hypothetical protein
MSRMDKEKHITLEPTEWRIVGKDIKGNTRCECPHCKHVHHLNWELTPAPAKVLCGCGMQMLNPKHKAIVEKLSKEWEEQKHRWQIKPL